MAKRERRPDDGSELDVVRASAIELMKNASPRLRRIKVHSGDADVELEWVTDEPRPAAGPVVGPVAGTFSAGPVTVAVEAAAVAAPVDENLLFIRSPIVGTFYHAPEPGAKPFVAAGGRVEKGQQIGIVEALKMMNPIEADCSGEVVEVLVADATPV
ncbi:acetyl-CoA carboxylase biotin carboxyl carrier protein, partial [Nonomuraea sp. KM90]|uniref:acetyl-CoA carboxylase biotin carboxyl carrier protein n=1 Tax=Nonomuraea sp. KM90 TaxID=3457428 RepID=UPI003FCDF3B7